MASNVQICNLALSHIGSRAFIQDLGNDSSVEARYCNLLFVDARQAVLRDAPHGWGFAYKVTALALKAAADVTIPANWTFAYAWPADCLRALRIVLADNIADPPPFAPGSDIALEAKVIFSDAKDAVLGYTADVTASHMFDAGFVYALSWRLAADLAPPLTGDRQIQDVSYRLYRQALDAALRADAGEGEPPPERDSEFIRVRL